MLLAAAQSEWPVLTITGEPYPEPRRRYYDAHYIAYREHIHEQNLARIHAERRARKLEHDAPMINAAEAKRQRKQAKRLLST